MPSLHDDANRFNINLSNRTIPPVPRRGRRREQFRVEFKDARRVPRPSAVGAAVRGWARGVEAPASKPVALKPRLRAFDSNALEKLTAVHESDSPLAELAQGQQMDAADLAGVLYASVIAHEYELMKVDLGKRRSTNPRAAREADEGWQRILVPQIRRSLSTAGLQIHDQRGLDRMVGVLTGRRRSYAAFLEIYRTGTKAANLIYDDPASTGGLVEPDTGVVVVEPPESSTIAFPPGWCDPTSGVRTETFSEGFRIRESITYPCGIRWKRKRKFGITYWVPDGVKYCTTTFTIAEGSVGFGVEIGYEIDCCGISVWGQAWGEACGGVGGQTICARCQVNVTGAPGVANGSSGLTCSYGVGISGVMTCSLGGIPVFAAPITFGWIITAPCPPRGAC